MQPNSDRKLNSYRTSTEPNNTLARNKIAIQNSSTTHDLSSNQSGMDFANSPYDADNNGLKVEIVEYRLSSYRWVYLVTFTIAVACGSIPSVGCATVATQLSDAYGVSIFMVNTVAVSGQIAYVPMSFLSIWMYQHYSAVLSMRLSCVICVLGCWFRMVSPLCGDAFWPYNVGTLIQSASLPLMLTGTTTFANFWMSEKERPFAIAISNMGVALGNMVSFVISGLYFAGVKKGDNAGYIKANQDMTMLQNYLCTGAYLLFFILVREKPEYPPCEAATHKIEQRTAFCKLLGVAMSKRSYKLLVFCFLVGNGSYTALTAIMSQIFAPFGYTIVQISMLAVMFIFVGVAAALGISVFLGRTRKYVCSQRFVSITIFVCFTAAIFTFPSQIFSLVLINMVIGGAVLLPIVPIGVAFGQELCRPMHPGISNGSLLMSGRLSGLVLSYAGAYFAAIDPDKPTYALIFFSVLNLMSALASLFIKEDFEPVIDKENLASILSMEDNDGLEQTNKHAMILRKSVDEQRTSMMKETRGSEYS